MNTIKYLVSMSIGLLLFFSSFESQAEYKSRRYCQDKSQIMTADEKLLNEFKIAWKEAVDSGISTRKAGLILAIINYVIDIPEEFIKTALNDKVPETVQAIASYPNLKPEFVKEIIEKRDPIAIRVLIEFNCTALPENLMEFLIENEIQKPSELGRFLVANKKLTIDQAKKINNSNDTAIHLYLAANYGIGNLEVLAKQIIKNKGHIEDVVFSMNQLVEFSEEVIDNLLYSPNEEVRSQLIKSTKFVPNEIQKEIILKDTSSMVVNTLLKRKDISLTQSQLRRGAAIDEDNGRYYWIDSRYHPVDDDIEALITSANAVKRSAFVGRDDVKLDNAQIDRALNDPDSGVRQSLLSRKGVELNELQMDQCTQDVDYSNKISCIQLPAYSLTSKRFNIILSDRNSNIVRLIMHPPKGKTWTNVNELLDSAIASNDSKLMFNIKNNRRLLPLTKEQEKYLDMCPL